MILDLTKTVSLTSESQEKPMWFSPICLPTNWQIASKRRDEQISKAISEGNAPELAAPKSYTRDEPAIAKIISRGGTVDQIEEGEEILVPTFNIPPVDPNPKEIKATRFKLVDAAQTKAKTIQQIEDAKIFETLNKAANMYKPIPGHGLKFHDDYNELDHPDQCGQRHDGYLFEILKEISNCDPSAELEPVKGLPLPFRPVNREELYRWSRFH